MDAFAAAHREHASTTGVISFVNQACIGFLIREDDIEKKLFSLIKSIHKDKDLLKTMKIKQKEQSNKEVFKIIDKEINGIFNEQH